MEITGSRSQPRSIDFSVPQGSCAGPVLYSAYASILQTVIPEGIDLNRFADNHNVKKSFGAGNKVDAKAVISDLESCTTKINEWMNVNRLKMSMDKTEFILFGSRYHLPKCDTMSINICGDTVVKSNKIKLLGAWLDENLSFKSHINIKCRTAMYNLQQICTIRKVLSEGACKTLVHRLVILHLDYVNALYCGLLESNLKKLQRVQNAAARVIRGNTQGKSINMCLKKVHWLPIKYRVQHKLLTLVYRCLLGEVPQYLQELLVEQPYYRQGLRSNDMYKRLMVPKTKRKTFADRSFSVAGPRQWNNLLDHVKRSPNVEQFKTELKMYLFRSTFNE